jgi:acyl-CoA thioesterase
MKEVDMLAPDKTYERLETSMAFSEALRSLVPQGQSFLAAPSAEWRQGRTLFGGLSAALSVAAAKAALPGLPPLRAAEFTFVGPPAGTLVLSPRLLRAGKSASFVGVDGYSESEMAVHATLLFAPPRRSSHSYRALPIPDVAHPDALPDFFDAPFAPVFSRQFEGRIAGGARPVSGAATPEILLWVRHRDPAAADSVESIIALGDVPPPAAMTMFATPAPISTITWSLEILDDSFAGTGWHLIHVAAETVRDGYSSQHMVLWEANGTPILSARQTVAVFG